MASQTPQLVDYNSLFDSITQSLDPVKLQEFKRLAVRAWNTANPVWEDWTPEELMSACMEARTGISVSQIWVGDRPTHNYEVYLDTELVAYIARVLGHWVFHSVAVGDELNFHNLEQLAELIRDKELVP